jgi:hypothetical protein
MTYKATVEISCLLGIVPYAQLTKRMQVPFLPPVGLQLSFKMREIRSAEEKTYRALATGCTNSTGVVIVESVIYFPEGSARGDSLSVLAEPIAEKEEAAIAAYVKLMQMFYGFEMELV